MSKSKIKTTLVDRISKYICHRGHKFADTSATIPTAASFVPWPCVDIDILRYSDTPSRASNDGRAALLSPISVKNSGHPVRGNRNFGIYYAI